jgi:hypothetical protein
MKPNISPSQTNISPSRSSSSFTMRTAARYVVFIACLIVATILFLSLFNIWQLGACHVFRSTCGTLVDRVIPGWRHGTHPRHTRSWVPGEGWVVEWSVTPEEKDEMLRQIEGQPIDIHDEL